MRTHRIVIHGDPDSAVVASDALTQPADMSVLL
jgi:hypothetical protein